MCSKNTHLQGSRLFGHYMSTGDVQVCHQSPMGCHCTTRFINLGVAVNTSVKTAASWLLMQAPQLVLTTIERLTNKNSGQVNIQSEHTVISVMLQLPRNKTLVHQQALLLHKHFTLTPHSDSRKFTCFWNTTFPICSYKNCTILCVHHLLVLMSHCFITLGQLTIVWTITHIIIALWSCLVVCGMSSWSAV